jgi:hypothetical protein
VAFYDKLAKRFVLTVLSKQTPTMGCPAMTTDGVLLVAVSANGDPTGKWWVRGEWRRCISPPPPSSPGAGTCAASTWPVPPLPRRGAGTSTAST